MSELIRVMHKRFGDTPVHRGRENNFLGIDMELKGDGTVELGMDDYIKESIDAFGKIL